MFLTKLLILKGRIVWQSLLQKIQMGTLGRLGMSPLTAPRQEPRVPRPTAKAASEGPLTPPGTLLAFGFRRSEVLTLNERCMLVRDGIRSADRRPEVSAILDRQVVDGIKATSETAWGLR